MRLVGMKIGRMKNRGEKIGVILGGRGVWLGWFCGRENGGPWLFSLQAHHFSIPPNWRENGEEKMLDENYTSNPSPPQN